MTFPYPQNPDDWQTAYTRDMGHHDSEKYGNRFAAPVTIAALIVLGYACFYAVRFFLSGTFSLIPNTLLAFIIVLLPLFFLGMTMRAVFRLAVAFFTEFYWPPENIDPLDVINNRLYGKPKLPPPLSRLSKFKQIIVKDGAIENDDEWPAWSARTLGGPLSLIVFDGCALYLERGNRFSRVVGPGDQLPFLELHETIKYVVDLRPKVKTDSFDAWTKDGIKVKFTVQIECRVGDPAKHDPASSLVYPFDPVAVKKAVERYSLRWSNRLDGEPGEVNWIDATWGQVTSAIPSYVGSRMLDDLFMADRNRGQILSPSTMKEISEKLNHATKKFGVYVTDLQILKIDLPKEVDELQRGYWRAERQSIATIVEGKTKALNIRTQEKSRADAQRDLIMAIADSLEKNISQGENEGERERFIEPLLLSFSNVLDESLSNPLLRANLAKDTLEVLEKLQNMLEKPDVPNIP